MSKSPWAALPAVVLTTLLILGCSAPRPVPRYASSADNVIAARAFRAQPLAVGEIRTINTDVQCWGQAIVPPDRIEWGEYVRRAILAELKVADAYSSDSGVRIEGRLENVTLDVTGGRWTMRLSLTTSTGRNMVVNSAYDYPVSATAVDDAWCERAREALVHAMQDLVGRALQHPDLLAVAEGKASAP